MFEKGQSGNPNGRPKGSSDRRRLFREMMEPHGEKLISKAIDMALNGNEAMLKLLLTRLMPAKPKEESLELPCSLTGTWVEQAEQIKSLITDGSITLGQGNQLLSILIDQYRLFEMTEVIRRLEALEKSVPIAPKKEFH